MLQAVNRFNRSEPVLPGLIRPVTPQPGHSGLAGNVTEIVLQSSDFANDYATASACAIE